MKGLDEGLHRAWGESMDGEAVARASGPLDWALDLERRLSLARPGDMGRGVFFRGALEEIRVLGGDEVARRCQEVCGQEKFVDFFNYPIGLYIRIISAAVPVLASRLGGVEEGLRRLGQRAARDFEACAAGRAVLLLAHGDARRMLDHLFLAYRALASYGERRVRWTGPRSGYVTLARDFLPYPFHEGLLEGLLGQMKLRGVRVRGRPKDVLDCECDFSWE